MRGEERVDVGEDATSAAELAIHRHVPRLDPEPAAGGGQPAGRQLNGLPYLRLREYDVKREMVIQQVIERFLETYPSRRNYFSRVAELCHDQCRDALIGEGIQHIASYRAKHPERLHEKVLQRAAKRKDGYASESEIQDDIYDLAGVRVALYFPGDATAAVKVLSGLFANVKEIPFPRPDGDPANKRKGSGDHTYRFAGYCATHLRVSLKENAIRSRLQYGEQPSEYAKARIEIQVASVFMHAWAEVEHDLVYKPQQGVLSVDDYSLLDQINGLALTAEVALQQLQRTRARATGPFHNHYDLASHIYTKIAPKLDSPPPMGRADRLLAFLRKLSLDRPDRIERFVHELRAGSFSLVQQVVDAIKEENPATARIWSEIEQTTTVGNPYESVADTEKPDSERLLRKHWQTFDDLARRVRVPNRREPWPDSAALQRLGFDRAAFRGIMKAYDVYTRLMTNRWNGDDDQLDESIETLEDAIRQLQARHGSAPGSNQ